MANRQPQADLAFGNQRLRVVLTGAHARFWSYQIAGAGRQFVVGAPTFEVEGLLNQVSLTGIRRVGGPVDLGDGCVEHCFEGQLTSDPELSLRMVFRLADDSPVLRFRYLLQSGGKHVLTKTAGRDQFTYLTVQLASLPYVTEVRLSEFNEMVHSYTLVEREVHPRQFDDQLRLIGPIVVAQDQSRAVLLAYEHGATAPDSFLAFELAPDRAVSLVATRGNYCHRQPLDPQRPYGTIWFQLAVVTGDRSTLARDYRRFVLRHLSANSESRKPYVFYNTWSFQERNKHWNDRPYLESMNRERMLQEIDAAHRLGVEVFVIDTGWYEKTGDWQVSASRFPDGLRDIKAKLDGYGMKLGLWFNPTAAAVSSRVVSEHNDCIMSWRGKRGDPHPIWETEASHNMCLVSRYADAFADELIRLNRELGVTYFKWDAVGQYGCDDPGHDHGTAANTDQDRADCYAFRLGLAMQKIAAKVREAVPEAIVDFDVTEAGRYVGLGWLSESKYFLINNGPYYQNYDLPLPPDQNWNMFFYPGQARGWVCRTPLSYDSWLPSVLFMTHYFPDEPASSQIANLASLVLGQNGVWGDLPGLPEEAVARWERIIGLYKQVRDDITESYPVRSGPVAGTPEIHEKISAATGRGVVVMFSTRAGSCTHVTEIAVADGWWHTDGVRVALDRLGRAKIEATFTGAGAQVVFFGVRE